MEFPGVRRFAVPCLLLFVTVLALSGCRPLRPLGPGGNNDRPHQAGKSEAEPGPALVEVAASERLWTGIAVSREGRLFVCFPRWSDDVPISVGEVLRSGGIDPFPDVAWNNWDSSVSPGEHFVCVQSLWMDNQDNLWILDAASPNLRAVVPGGAKLLRVDISTGKVLQNIVFDETAAPAACYLNDVRVDTDRGVAYITDSGLGALVVVDLKAEKARRVLAGHPSTKSENVVLTIEGEEWRPGGAALQVHADGLALDPTGEFLYYQALTGRTLYRIETRWLRDPAVTERILETKVESLYQTCAADGMGIGPDGYLYLTSVEDGAIKLFASLGKVEIVVCDPRLKWPDSIAWGPDGNIHVTTSQIHLGDKRLEPYRIFKIAMP
jgi:sugar lactone lactonase YvrE